MFELVPSAYMRSLFEKHGFVLTDFQKATLIWNAPGKSIDEKLSALKELSEATQDKELFRQIEERIFYEEEAFRRFKDNSAENYFYVVITGCSDYDDSIGYFADFSMVWEYLLQLDKDDEVQSYCIEKQTVVKSEKDLLVKRVKKRFNPNMMSDDFEDVAYMKYKGQPVSTLYFDKNIRIKNIYSCEMPASDEERVSEYKEERFEYHYIKIPFEGYVGMMVRNTWNGSYGVLAMDAEQMLEMNRRIEENNLYVDFSDVAVTVYFLTEQGLWSHEHINPIYYLEPEEYPVQAGDKKSEAYKNAMDSFAKYLKDENKANSDEAVKCIMAYRHACFEEEMDENKRFHCTNIEDVMI